MKRKTLIAKSVLIVILSAFIPTLASAQTQRKQGLPIEVELGVLRGYPVGNLSPYGLRFVDQFQSPMHIVSSEIMYKINNNHSLGVDYWGGGNIRPLTQLNSVNKQTLNYIGLGYSYSLPKEAWLARFTASIGYVRNDHELKGNEQEIATKAYGNGFGFSLGASASLFVTSRLSIGLKGSINALMLGKWSGESKDISPSSYFSNFGNKESNSVVMPMIGVVLMTR